MSMAQKLGILFAVARARGNAAYDCRRLVKLFTALGALCDMEGREIASEKPGPPHCRPNVL